MMKNGMRVISVALAMILLLQAEAYTPVTYEVGGDEGWDLSIDMESWVSGKSFHTGDLLHFVYDDQRFDVAVVNKEGYNSCTVNDGAKMFESGDDTIQLAFGSNYFIDSESDICAAGLKMAIDATAPPPDI